ncbi:hypothetical protein C7974DRAFT_416760 [Boeremia exigua]|uniref:uncharacterized protein n=1 Tax=Boeremia exigua TaxID=749465 RepID=UPI001E8E2D94|nr:uncharacterized protein C7974DRAFT_416760 [Boeremia exigua]KAH6616640.1 hypothetical protein C7974DRAFT_416760 [Boeremia exigua]
MAFQRLNIRAKKSLPGLYSFENTNSYHSPKNATAHHELSPCFDITPDTEDDLEDFGAKLERCKGTPSKDSPSKRKRLFGSLRSLRSLANLHSSPSKTIQIEKERTETTVNHMRSSTTQLPRSISIAPLKFEQSISDKLTFELRLHDRSVSNSSMEVQHSSPMTVPGSVRQISSLNIIPSAIELPTGTIPSTPGPMQRAFDRDPANFISWQGASPTPLERYVPTTPILTPLPGTNLSAEDLDRRHLLLPSSNKPSEMQMSQDRLGYFDIQVDEQPQMNNTDRLNGLACLILAEDHEDITDREENAAKHLVAKRCDRPCSSSMKMGQAGVDITPQDSANALDCSQGQPCENLREPHAEVLGNSIRAQALSRHSQVLPFRPKQSEEDLQDRPWNDSVISEGWETCSGRHSIDTPPERTPDGPHQSGSTRTPTDNRTSASSQGCGSSVDCGESPVDIAYIVWDSPKKSRLSNARKNIWRQHTGLYDGSAYGKVESGPSTPKEPDEGTNDVQMRRDPHPNEASLMTRSIHGDCHRGDIINCPAKGESQNSERVQDWPPRTASEENDDESLEFIYRAYA